MFIFPFYKEFIKIYSRIIFAEFDRLVLSLEHFIESAWVGWSTGKSIPVMGAAGQE